MPNLTVSTAVDDLMRSGDEAEIRTLVGGMKTGLADGAAVLLSTPEYVGQIAIGQDGYLAVANGAGVGDWTGNLVLAAPITYFTTLDKGGAVGTINSGNITGIATGGTFFNLSCTGGTFADNVVSLHNTTGGYSAIAMWHADDGGIGGRGAAFGIGPDGAATNQYHNAVYLASNTSIAAPDVASPNIIISQERADGTPSNQHARLFCDGAAKSVSLYGWSTSDIFGPLGLTVTSNGKVRVGAGTSTIENANFNVGGSLCGIGYLDRAYADGLGVGWVTYVDSLIYNILDNQDFRGLQIGSVAGVFFVRPNVDGSHDLGDATHRWKSFYVDRTITAAATTGAQTIHKSSGSVNFAAAATSLVVTNNLVTTSSLVIATVQTNDATAHSVKAVVAAGSFTLTLNAAATAETKVAFLVLN